MANIFVYHARDSEGGALAGLIRDCDIDRAFEYLPVESAASTRRMERFLRQHGLDPERTRLPFIILVTGDADRQGSVLHGDVLGQWLSKFV